MNKEAFSQRLKTAIKEQCISQSDLARMTGLGRANISQYVTGIYRPRPAVMKRIAEALNVPLGWLTGEIDETEESLKVLDVAKILNVLPQKVRMDLQARRVSFGYAVNKNGRFRYYISPTKFEKYLNENGIRQPEALGI